MKNTKYIIKLNSAETDIVIRSEKFIYFKFNKKRGIFR